MIRPPHKRLKSRADVGLVGEMIMMFKSVETNALPGSQLT